MVFPKARTTAALNIYGRVRGGFEGTDIDLEAPIESRERTQNLIGIDEAFGCYVVDTSMEPRYMPGEIVYVNPRLPLRAGVDVVVELSGRRGMVKTFMSQSDDAVTFSQLNPKQSRKIRRSEIGGVYCIVAHFPAN
jgi:phage repressor protein C with HTH and peptisase S24 domain